MIGGARYHTVIPRPQPLELYVRMEARARLAASSVFLRAKTSPWWTRQLEPRKALGAYFFGRAIYMDGLKFPGAGRGANSCPELSLYVDTEREPQPAEGRVSQWELPICVFQLRERKKAPPKSFSNGKMGAPSRRYPFLSSSEAMGRGGGRKGLHDSGDRGRGRAG